MVPRFVEFWVIIILIPDMDGNSCPILFGLIIHQFLCHDCEIENFYPLKIQLRWILYSYDKAGFVDALFRANLWMVQSLFVVCQGKKRQKGAD